MAETHEQWLNRLESRSRAAQQAFMDGIAGRLGHSLLTEKPPQPFRGAPDFWNELEWTREQKVQAFVDNFHSVGGHPVQVASLGEAAAFIAAKAEEMSACRLIRQNEPELASLELESRLPAVEIAVWNSGEEESPLYWKGKAAEADFGVVMADYGVAYTGSAVVLSANWKGRSVSLLPTALFILIPVDRLRTRLGEVMSELDAAGRDGLPAGVHFISGPSRSSDIENDLTIGVHGPGIVYALLVDEPSA